MNEWCLRSRFCACKAILGRGQTGLMILMKRIVVVVIGDLGSHEQCITRHVPELRLAFCVVDSGLYCDL